MKEKAIYAIRHLETGRLYIGSTKDLAFRWRLHRTALRAGKHHSPRLQNAWNKYGEEDFEFMLVHKVNDERDLIFWEQFWIDRLKPYFNILKVAGSPLGRRHSDEAKAKMSVAKTGSKMSSEARKAMSKAAKGRSTSDTHRAALSAATKRQMSDPVARDRLADMFANKHWQFFSPTGELVEFDNLQKFCRENGLFAAAMHRVSTGKAKYHKGWTKAGKEAAMNTAAPLPSQPSTRIDEISLEPN